MAFYGPLGNIVLLSHDSRLDFSAYCDNVQNFLIDRFQCSIAIGIGGRKKGAGEISLSYEEARKALEYTVIEGKNALLLFSDVNLSKEGEEIRLDRLLRDFSFALGAGLKERSEDIAFKVLNVHERGSFRDMLSIRISASNLISVILNTILEGDIPMETLFSRENQPYDRIFRIETLPEMKAYMMQLIEKVSDSVNAVQTHRISTLVKEVCHYLKDNFCDPELSQTGTALHFSVNSSYLSRKFKEETGETFVDYLAKVRIEKAIDLFKNSDKRNYEVADAIGIADPHYFSIFFKRHMGMSVSDYRKEINC